MKYCTVLLLVLISVNSCASYSRDSNATNLVDATEVEVENGPMLSVPDSDTLQGSLDIDLGSRRQKTAFEEYWKFEGSEFSLIWDSEDLLYKNGSTQKGIFSTLVFDRMKELCIATSSNGATCGCVQPGKNMCTSSFELRLLSFFGKLITVEARYRGTGGTMRDGEDVSLATIDLAAIERGVEPDHDRNLSENVRMSDLFDDAEILKEILKSPAIRSAFAVSFADDTAPSTASELSQRLDRGEVRLITTDGMEVRSDFLLHFAVDSYDEGTAMVRSRLYHARDPLVFEDLILKLKAPEHLRPALLSASKRISGYLGADSTHITKKATRFTFLF